MLIHSKLLPKIKSSSQRNIIVITTTQFIGMEHKIDDITCIRGIRKEGEKAIKRY